MKTKGKPAGGRPAGGDGDGVESIGFELNYTTLPEHFRDLLQQADRLAERDPNRLPEHNAIWHAIFAAGLRHKFSPATEKQKRFLIRLIRELGKAALTEARQEIGIHAPLLQLSKPEARRLIDALVQRRGQRDDHHT